MTYCLTDAGISGLGYSSHEDHAGQENMKTQVHKHVPALETDPNQAVGKERNVNSGVCDAGSRALTSTKRLRPAAQQGTWKHLKFKNLTYGTHTINTHTQTI